MLCWTNLPRATAVLVLEDLHWADEATLDVFRLLGARIEDARRVIVVTYRDDELDRAHPLWRVLGELASHTTVEACTSNRSRQRPSPSSRGAARVDAAELYRDLRQPVLRTEVLEAAPAMFRRSVRDAVLARRSGVSHRGQEVVDTVARCGPGGADVARRASLRSRRRPSRGVPRDGGPRVQWGGDRVQARARTRGGGRDPDSGTRSRFTGGS